MLATLQRDSEKNPQSALEGLFNPGAAFGDAVRLCPRRACCYGFVDSLFQPVSGVKCSYWLMSHEPILPFNANIKT